MSPGSNEPVSPVSIDGDMAAEIAKKLAQSQSVLFITGAGISADSGLPTYRGIGGLYNDGGTEEGYPIEVALSGEMLLHRPDITWKHMARVEEACRGARPNRGHEILALIEARLPRVWVLTQNVDNFHVEAGSKNLIEMHGNLRHLVCMGCARRQFVDDYSDLDIPPSCSECGRTVRPEVVLFGERLPRAAVDALFRELETGFDMVLTIGTTSVFPYIARPVHMARAQGKTTVEINPGESEVSDVVDYRVRAGARDALEAIWQAMPG